MFDREDVVLFFGPFDGKEMTVEAPPRQYLVFEHEKVIYRRQERYSHGKRVYDYDYDGTQIVRKRWLEHYEQHQRNQGI